MKEETCACAPVRNFSGKQLLGFGLGIASLVILFLAPESADLSHEALTSIGVLLCCVFHVVFRKHVHRRRRRPWLLSAFRLGRPADVPKCV